MPDEHHAAHEIAIQRSVAQQGYPAPTVRLADATDATLGRPFILMDRADGQPLLANLDLRRAFATLPRILSTLPTILAEQLAALHRLDPEPTRRALAAAGVLDQVDGTAALLKPLSNSPGVAHVAGLRARPRLAPRQRAAHETTPWCATATCTRSTSSPSAPT